MSPGFRLIMQVRAVQPWRRRDVATPLSRWLSSRRRITAMATLALCLGLGACVLVGGPDLRDLRLNQVDVVDLNERPEMRRLSLDPPRLIALMVTFRTATDLVRHSLRYGVTAWPDVSFCGPRGLDPDRLLSTHGAVHDQHGEVTFRYDEAPALQPDAQGRYTFHAFILLENSRVEEVFGSRPVRYRAIYDLRRDPEDICFRIRGGNMLGGAYTSNTVRIPAAAIRAAVERAGMAR